MPRRFGSARLAQEAQGAGDCLKSSNQKSGRAAASRPLCVLVHDRMAGLPFLQTRSLPKAVYYRDDCSSGVKTKWEMFISCPISWRDQSTKKRTGSLAI
jgi:hypothetical protein